MRSQLKRPSLVRLLASLCPPPSSRASSFPVQTGFPTSLADLVVRNHGRLRKPRKPRPPTSAAALAPPPSTVAQTAEVADELPLLRPTRPLSPVSVKQLDAAPQGAAFFRLRPEVLALGGAVALALLAVWRDGTVAALTVVALSLLWIESASRRRPRPAETVALQDSRGRPASPVRDAEVAPRSTCSGSDKGTGRSEPVAAGDEPTTPKRKAKRTLRRMISKKLQKKPKSNDSSSSWDGEAEYPETAIGDADPVLKTESSVAASESSVEWSSSSLASEPVAVVDRRGSGDKFPLSAFVPVILAGLAAGKLPATALAVLSVVFSSAVRRL